MVGTRPILRGTFYGRFRAVNGGFRSPPYLGLVSVEMEERATSEREELNSLVARGREAGALTRSEVAQALADAVKTLGATEERWLELSEELGA